jgi:hypothetical protein
LEELELMLTDLEGEIPEGEIGAAIEKWFDSLTEERDEKIRRMCGLIEMMQVGAEHCDDIARRITKLKRANQNGAERLKERLKQFFEEHGIKKLDLQIFKPRIQANGGALPLIFPEEWELVPASAPERFHKPVILLDKEAMREEAEFTADQIRQLKAKLDAETVTPQEYEDRLHIAQHTNPVRLGERGSHLRLR